MSLHPIKNARAAQAARPTKPLVLKYWMTPTPHTIGKGQPLRVAETMMRDHQMRHLPVLDHGKLVGIISQRDLYFVEAAGMNLDEDPVEDGMSQSLYCASPDARLTEVVAEMTTHKYGCTVAVDKTNRVVGLFTTIDALELLAGFLGEP